MASVVAGWEKRIEKTIQQPNIFLSQDLAYSSLPAKGNEGETEEGWKSASPPFSFLLSVSFLAAAAADFPPTFTEKGEEEGRDSSTSTRFEQGKKICLESFQLWRMRRQKKQSLAAEKLSAPLPFPGCLPGEFFGLEGSIQCIVERLCRWREGGREAVAEAHFWLLFLGPWFDAPSPVPSLSISQGGFWLWQLGGKERGGGEKILLGKEVKNLRPSFRLSSFSLPSVGQEEKGERVRAAAAYRRRRRRKTADAHQQTHYYNNNGGALL